MSDMQETAGVAAKVPVWRGFAYSYGFLFKNLIPLIRVGIIPMILFGALSYFITMSLSKPFIIASLQGDVSAMMDFWWQYILGYVAMLPLVPFATAWHRYSITGDSSYTALTAIRVGKAEFIFLGYYILVSLITMIPAFLSMAVVFGGTGGHIDESRAVMAVPLILGSFAIGVFLWVRLSLIFPAAAIGAPAGLGDSWRATKGSFWRSFWIWFLSLLPIAFLLPWISTLVSEPFLLEAIQGQQSDEAIDRFLQVSVVMNVVTYWLLGGFLIGTLSYIYKFLTEKDVGESVDTEVFD